MNDIKSVSLSELLSEIGLEETVKVAVEQLGMTESYARFVIAMELGEIDGDVIEVKP